MTFPTPQIKDAAAKAIDKAAHHYLNSMMNGEPYAAFRKFHDTCDMYGKEATVYRTLYFLAEHITLTCPEAYRTAQGVPRVNKLLPSLPAAPHAPTVVREAGCPLPDPDSTRDGLIDVQRSAAIWSQRIIKAVDEYDDDEYRRTLGEALLSPSTILVPDMDARIDLLLTTLAVLCRASEKHRMAEQEQNP